MTAAARDPKRIFISYSHKDTRWLDLIKSALKPVLRGREVDLWDDRRIEAGSEWKSEIEGAMRRVPKTGV